MGKNSYKVEGSKILPVYMDKPRVIIYDDENIQYIVGSGACFEWEPQHMYFESIDGTRTPFDMGVDIKLRLDEVACHDNIMLDNTTMRRIAVFNKEQECKRLDDEIEKKKERIKELDDILKDREHRVDKIKKYIAGIYDIDISDDDEWDD